MDTASPSGPNASRRATLAAALLIAAYALILAWLHHPGTVAYDANGYWAQGSLIATQARTWFRPACGAQHLGMHWLLGDDGRYVSRYPPGLAVLVAGLYGLFGFRAGTLLNPILAVAALIGFHLLARRLLRPWMAVAATALLATNGLFLFHSLTADSHMAVVCLLLWGCWFLLRWHDRPGPLAAGLTGLCFGAIPTIRYPEALLALGPAVIFLANWRRLAPRWPDLLAAAVGALLPLGPLLVRNHLLFGAFWKTGYALTNEQSAFAWHYFVAHVPRYLRDLWQTGLVLGLVLGLGGLAWLVARHRTRLHGLFLLAMVVPLALLYFAYYWMLPGNPYATLRFLLPQIVLLTLAAAVCLERLASHRPAAWPIALVAAVLLAQGCWSGAIGWHHARSEMARCQILDILTGVLERQVPPGSVIIAHPRIQDYLDYVRHWKLVDSTLLDGHARQEMQKTISHPPDSNGVNAIQTRKWETFAALYGTPGSPELQRRLARDIRAWAGQEKVYFIGAKEDIRWLKGDCFWPDHFVDRLETELPRPPGHPGPPKKLLLAEWTWPAPPTEQQQTAPLGSERQ